MKAERAMSIVHAVVTVTVFVVDDDVVVVPFKFLVQFYSGLPFHSISSYCEYCAKESVIHLSNIYAKN